MLSSEYQRSLQAHTRANRAILPLLFLMQIVVGLVGSCALSCSLEGLDSLSMISCLLFV